MNLSLSSILALAIAVAVIAHQSARAFQPAAFTRASSSSSSLCAEPSIWQAREQERRQRTNWLLAKNDDKLDGSSATASSRRTPTIVTGVVSGWVAVEEQRRKKTAKLMEQAALQGS